MYFEKREPMSWHYRLGVGLLSLALLGCHGPLQESQLSQGAPPEVGQVLPITARATLVGQVIDLEVAKTPQQQAQGLMYRRSLADNRGMLFTFDPPQPVSFWMKNTKIPLDMIFLQGGKVIAIVAEAPPCTTTPCPTYGPDQPVPIDQVIELRGGRAAELGLKVGDPVTVKSQAPVN